MDHDIINEIEYLRSPKTIRECCYQIFSLAKENKLEYFRLEMSRIDNVVNYVIEEMKKNYPDQKIPIHGRLRHLEVGGINRPEILKDLLQEMDHKDFGRVLFELIFISVLLDAGAGNQWEYNLTEEGKKVSYCRSEGLAVASYHMFTSGLFSSDPNNPYQVNSMKLRSLSESELSNAFQVSSKNPLVGISGRLKILHGLADALTRYFKTKSEKEIRLGLIYDEILKLSPRQNNKIEIGSIFNFLLLNFSDIWPNGLKLGSINIGDVGKHTKINANEKYRGGLVPFHKLTQWLSYSLLESFEVSGVKITKMDQLTGLPEYRNGGLLIDLGVLNVKNDQDLNFEHDPMSEFVVEWRALTVTILDIIAEKIREKLNVDAVNLPLARILQGGTWSAGRKIAKTNRKDGSPPIMLKSNGTIF